MDGYAAKGIMGCNGIKSMVPVFWEGNFEHVFVDVIFLYNMTVRKGKPAAYPAFQTIPDLRK